jgi:hypothetical protein
MLPNATLKTMGNACVPLSPTLRVDRLRSAIETVIDLVSAEPSLLS